MLIDPIIELRVLNDTVVKGAMLQYNVGRLGEVQHGVCDVHILADKLVNGVIAAERVDEFVCCVHACHGASHFLSGLLVDDIGIVQRLWFMYQMRCIAAEKLHVVDDAAAYCSVFNSAVVDYTMHGGVGKYQFVD